MPKLPGIIGPAAFGLKMGAVVPGTDLQKMLLDTVKEVEGDNMLDDGDILCITESVVARAQNNYVSLSRIVDEVREKLGIKPDGHLGVVFPILSRNRFALVLKALSRAVKKGRLTLLLSFPCDEVGNQLIGQEQLEELGKDRRDLIPGDLLSDLELEHPITGVNYLELYREIVAGEGAEADILLANDPCAVLQEDPDGIIAADIHQCRETQRALKEAGNVPCITLQDICCEGKVSSRWGLLGSNLSAEERLKLLPRDGDRFVTSLQELIQEETGYRIHILIYGDGAYRDPTTGIYELADPQTTFGATRELRNKLRQGIKYKYFADKLHSEGKGAEEIENTLRQKRREKIEKNSFDSEGTTPRQLTDVLASLADLVSGSADAGTPAVLIKNFLSSAHTTWAAGTENP